MTGVSFVRRKEVRVGFDLLVHVFTKGTEIHARITNGLPVAARLIHLDMDTDTLVGEARLIFEHESFEPTPPGEPLPSLRVDVETIPPPTHAEERGAIRGAYRCSACGEAAYIASLDFLSYMSERDIPAYIPAGRVRYGCPQHPPRKEVIVQCASRQEAEALLTRPLDLNARIVDAAHGGARG